MKKVDGQKSIKADSPKDTWPSTFVPFDRSVQPPRTVNVDSRPSNLDWIRSILMLTVQCTPPPYITQMFQSFWHRWLVRDRKWGILAFLHRFGHILVKEAKMPHFKGKNEMGHFGIGMHIHASDLSLSQSFLGILTTLVYHRKVRGRKLILAVRSFQMSILQTIIYSKLQPWIQINSFHAIFPALFFYAICLVMTLSSLIREFLGPSSSAFSEKKNPESSLVTSQLGPGKWK